MPASPPPPPQLPPPPTWLRASGGQRAAHGPSAAGRMMLRTGSAVALSAFGAPLPLLLFRGGRGGSAVSALFSLLPSLHFSPAAGVPPSPVGSHRASPRRAAGVLPGRLRCSEMELPVPLGSGVELQCSPDLS